MTCIAAIAENGNVWMSADSAGVAGHQITVRRDPKIFRVEGLLIGYTSSFRMGQLLGYKLAPPEHKEGVSVEHYLHCELIDALRKTLKDGGYARTKDGCEEGGTFLLGYRGRLFRVDSDFQIGESALPFDAVGCGAELALGSMHATNVMNLSPSPSVRLFMALEAAEAFSSGVRRPFMLESLEAA